MEPSSYLLKGCPFHGTASHRWMVYTPARFSDRNVLPRAVNSTWQVVNWLCALIGIVVAGVVPHWIGVRATLFVAIG
jgi:hypothetical protein